MSLSNADLAEILDTLTASLQRIEAGLLVGTPAQEATRTLAGVAAIGDPETATGSDARRIIAAIAIQKQTLVAIAENCRINPAADASRTLARAADSQQVDFDLIDQVAAVLAEIGVVHHPEGCSEYTLGHFNFDLPGMLRYRGYFSMGLNGVRAHYCLPNHTFAYEPTDAAKTNPTAFAREFVGHMCEWAANEHTAADGWHEHIALILGVKADAAT